MPAAPRVRYGAFDDGPDPLAAPPDVAAMVDAVTDRVLAGEGTAEAVREVLRRGADGRPGLAELSRRIRARRREVTARGRLDGTLTEVRELLDEAVAREQAALFPDPSDDARLTEAMLASLPSDTARAVRELTDYQWRSPEARSSFEQIEDLLRREVLDQQFSGLKQAIGQAHDNDRGVQHAQQMVVDLNELLQHRRRGEDTPEDFEAFMRKHGDMFPSAPATLDELIDELARRSSAAARLLNALTDEQRQELTSLMESALSDSGLAGDFAQLGDHLRSLRPESFRRSDDAMVGSEPLGLGDATEALAELADLETLEEQLGQSYAGARLDDIDERLVQQTLGRQSVDDIAHLRALERGLTDQDYLVRRDGEPELTPKAVRRLGKTALRHVFSDMHNQRRGDHDVRDSGASGEPTGASRPWEFGDEQQIDVVRTVRNAVMRSGGGHPVGLTVDDFEVIQTDRRTSAAICLLVDTSYSMVVNDTWGAAKRTALALHSLISTAYPQDALQIIGFSEYAAELRPHQLAGLDFAMVQGTNLQHALVMAGRFVDSHPAHEPLIIVVTDGEPTARLDRRGRALFSWPPEPETIAATVAEVDKMTRRGAALNVFILGDDPRLRSFVDEVARRNGGRVFAPQAERLGEFVIQDFLDRRRRVR